MGRGIHEVRPQWHSSQETNSAIEGYHTSIKAMLGTDKVLLQGRHVDWLVFMLSKKVLATARDRAVSKLCGFEPNIKQEKATIQAVREVSSPHSTPCVTRPAKLVTDATMI